MAEKIRRQGGTGMKGSAYIHSAGSFAIASPNEGFITTLAEQSAANEGSSGKTGGSSFENYWAPIYDDMPIPNVGIHNGRGVSNIFASIRTPEGSYDEIICYVIGYWIRDFIPPSYSGSNAVNILEYMETTGTRYWDETDQTYYLRGETSILRDMKDFVENPAVSLKNNAEGVAFSRQILSEDDYYTYNSSITSSEYGGCQLVLSFVSVSISRVDTGSYTFYHGCQYTYDGVCDFLDEYPAPTKLAHSNGYLSWSNGTGGYPTCLEFYLQGQNDTHLGQTQTTRTHAYEVICQSTEGKYATGWAELGSNARFKMKTIPLYYAPNDFGAPKSFYNAFKTAVFDAVDSINAVIEPLGFKISTPVERSYSVSSVEYYADISDLPNGITVVCGTNEILNGPTYNWGNWEHNGSGGYITKSKALIYYQEDFPYIGETIDPLVLEEILESMGPGGDSASLYKTVFADFVAADKPKALTEVKDIGTVKLCYTEAPFNTLQEAGVRLRPTWGARRLPAGTTGASLAFLEAGRTYNIRLWHYQFSYDRYSPSAQINNIAIPAVGAPSIPSATRKDGGGIFSWTLGTNATGYNLVITSNWDEVERLNADTQGLSYTYTGLPYGVTHTVKVRAYMNWGGEKLYSAWSTAQFTTNPARPTATVSTSKGVITVDWALEDTDSGISIVYFTLYKSDGTTVLQSKSFSTTSGTFDFTTVEEGTYILKAQSQLTIGSNTLVCLTNEGAEYKFEKTIRVSDRPEKFYWSDYTSALYAGGPVNQFPYTAWNAFTENIKAVVENAGYGDLVLPTTTAYGSAAGKTFSVALSSHVRMSPNTELSKSYFNTCNYIIDWVASATASVSTSIGIKTAHNPTHPVSYSEFITLQDRLNDIP